MVKPTATKPSLTNPTTDPENDSETSNKAKEISPPSNLPKETSKPTPVPVVNYTADETKEKDPASIKNEIPKIAKEVKEISKEIEAITKKEDDTKKIIAEADSSGPLDFKALKSKPSESEPSEPELPKLEPESEPNSESESEPEIKTPELKPEFQSQKKETEVSPVKITTTSSPSTAKHLDTPKPIAQSADKRTPNTNNAVSSLTKKEDAFTSELKNIRQGKEKNQSINVTSGINKTIIVAVGILVLLTIGVGAYYYFGNTSQEQSDAFDLEIKPVTNNSLISEEKTATVRNPFELATKSKAIEIVTLQELNAKILEIKASASIGEELTQLIPALDGKEITSLQLKEALGLLAPAEIIKNDKQSALLAVKEGEVIKIGLVIETTSSPELVKSQMLAWEKTMVGDLRPLLLGEIAEDPANPEDFRFRDSDKFPNGRFINLSESKNISIDYSILADKILIGTSYTMVENLVKLLEK